jgi:hypothetical protein
MTLETTTSIVGLPFLALVIGVIGLWGEGVHPRDVVLVFRATP